MSTQAQIQFPVHSNSIEVYRDNVLPNLSQREQDCLNALRYLGGATVSEVATYMKVFQHTISGRFTSLKAKGKVKVVGIRRINGRPNDIFEIETDNTGN